MDEITFTMQIDGQKVTMIVLFTFYSELTNANYMIYTPDDDDVQEVSISAARYDPANPNRLLPLKDDTDRALVQSFIDYVSNKDDLMRDGKTIPQ